MAKQIRRLEAPWRVEDTPGAFVVRAANGFLISLTYWDNEPKREFTLKKEEARRVAVAISRLPELLQKEEK